MKSSPNSVCHAHVFDFQTFFFMWPLPPLSRYMDRIQAFHRDNVLP